MYIQEIIIDGFKSYATRTVVSGFDPQFNAITGLNGSGKSNILDSICFVLGISNLSQVRVGNLQELVYKQGQAGVTKASVTIVFNNPDPASSPVGYEQNKQITVTRQVVIGGKNKYLINGHTSHQSQVQNLFHSVQLNVNNPHFLIMQGRITKVLNMKPPEILSMIEEAAGTRMFETKKQAALKTIEKKQQKVDEITRVMDDDISPKLGQLRSERQNYMEWSSNTSKLEKLEHLCVAYEYQTCENQVSKAESDQSGLEKKIKDFSSQQDAFNKDIEEYDRKISELSAQKNDNYSHMLEAAKKSEQNLSKQLVKINSTFNHQKETLQQEKELLSTLAKQLETNSQSLVDRQQEWGKMEVLLGVKEKEVTAAEQEVITLRNKYSNACAGVTDEKDAELLSLPEQIGVWEKSVRETQSKLQQETMRIEHAKNRIKELTKQIKQEQSMHTKDIKESEAIRLQVQDIQTRLAKISYSEEEEISLRVSQSQIESQMQQCGDMISNLTAQLEARLNFQFTDPERGFNRNRVKGVIAKLIRVHDDVTATAVEVAAGGKLFQVVVDNEITGASLIKNGNLKKRVTFLPLNKINSRCMDPAKVERSKAVASQQGGSAHLALELVGYEEEVKRAMQFTFGNTIVCSSSEIAQAITFNNDIRCKTVTLDGDTFDPSGTVTGGSKNQIGILLSKISELSRLQEQYNEYNAELTNISKKLQKLEANGAAVRELTSSLELKTHALSICDEKLSGSSYAQMVEEMTGLDKEVAQFNADVVVPCNEKIKHANEELKKLTNAAANIKSQREHAMKRMEKDAKDAQKHLNALKSALLDFKTTRDKLGADINAITSDSKAIGDQRDICASGLNRLEADLIQCETEVSSTKSQYEEAKSDLQKIQNTIQQFSKEIKSMESNKEKLAKNISNINLDIRKVQHELNEMKKDMKDCKAKVVDMLKKFSWIESEKAFFGLPGSDYDFDNINMKDTMKKMSDLREVQEKTSKKVNKKVMGMIDKAETENSELRRKKEVILNDKAKIEAVIEELDVKKVEALQATWVKVNRDFGSIFSTLLPGTHAKLEIPEGCTLMDGLEVKVAFNGVWKQSLTELSGGQRSLLALSLILSLLLFKPAPMYILDEVDAALDLSHTQNIGLMLRNHFSSSQFIVVSLKEGMFNNANVIFRTRFVDGISTVTRTVVGTGKSSNKLLTNRNPNVTVAVEDESEDEVNSPQKKRGKSNSKSKRQIATGTENSSNVVV